MKKSSNILATIISCCLLVGGYINDAIAQQQDASSYAAVLRGQTSNTGNSNNDVPTKKNIIDLNALQVQLENSISEIKDSSSSSSADIVDVVNNYDQNEHRELGYGYYGGKKGGKKGGGYYYSSRHYSGKKSGKKGRYYYYGGGGKGTDSGKGKGT